MIASQAAIFDQPPGQSHFDAIALDQPLVNAGATNGLCDNRRPREGSIARDTRKVHMYAVIKTGGKQYRVAAGESIKVEQIAAEVGQKLVFNEVLAIGNGADVQIGTPLVPGATVSVTVVAHGKHDKVGIFKMRRRKHYRKQQGHRQQFTQLLVDAICPAAPSTPSSTDA